MKAGRGQVSHSSSCFKHSVDVRLAGTNEQLTELILHLHIDYEAFKRLEGRLIDTKLSQRTTNSPSDEVTVLVITVTIQALFILIEFC
jgi:hypothetical protein